MIPASLRLPPGRRVCACGTCVRAWGCVSRGRAWRAGARALARGGAGCGQVQTRVTPFSCVATSVIDVYTTNVCDYVNSVVFGAIGCVVNLGLFLLFLCFFFLFVWFVGLFYFAPFPLPASVL